MTHDFKFEMLGGGGGREGGAARREKRGGFSIGLGEQMLAKVTDRGTYLGFANYF